MTIYLSLVSRRKQYQQIQGTCISYSSKFSSTQTICNLME